MSELSVIFKYNVSLNTLFPDFCLFDAKGKYISGRSLTNRYHIVEQEDTSLMKVMRNYIVEQEDTSLMKVMINSIFECRRKIQLDEGRLREA